MDHDIFGLLKQLAEIPGPVGREGAVQHFLRNTWKEMGIKISEDKVGNLFGRLEGDGKHIAVVGHADTIGFLVQQILPNGFLKVAFNTAATTPDARFLSGVPLKFLTDVGPIEGHIGLRSGHLAGIEGKKKPVLFPEIFIDLGIDSDQEVRALGIDIGTPAIFASNVVHRQRNIVGPGMDNRVALTLQCLLTDEILRRRASPNLTLVSTVQEEIGMKGAAAAALREKYDLVIIIDVGLVGDIPSSEQDFLPTKLGAGPIVVYKDFSIHYSIDNIKILEKSAQNSDIPIQKAVFSNFNTDGVHFFQRGHPTVMVAVPTRYTHTDFETVRMNDVQATLDLLAAAILDEFNKP
ncbi:MAG: M42 family metallopeptidase [Candidatus Heimdallarchaeota archaeon]